MHTVMSVRANDYGLDLAAWLTFMRTVWVNKDDEAGLAQASSVLTDLELEVGIEKGSGRTIPDNMQERIRKKGGNRLLRVVSGIVKRGYYTVQTLPMRHGPTTPQKRNKFYLCKRPYSRLVVFRYDPREDAFIIPKDRKGTLGYLYYWNPIEFRDILKEGLSAEDAKLFSTLLYIKRMLRSRNVERDYHNHTMTVGSGVFQPLDHTEYNPKWVAEHKLDMTDTHNKGFHITRDALSNVDTAKFMGFVFNHELGPVMLDMQRLVPRVDFTFPDDIQISDPWIFNGEQLELEL